MNTIPLLTGLHLRTYETIFQHPISHNLGWRDVHSLFRKLGEVEEEPNGNLKVTRNGQTLVLRPSHAKDVTGMDDLMGLRHFLERSGTTLAESGDEAHWLLVIDHREARIFRSEMHGSIPQRILPHAAEEYFHHTRDSQETSRGKEKREPGSYFEPVAKALQAAGQILVFGMGTGTGTEMEQFVAWTKLHHPELATRIIGSVVVDERHLTVDQLLAKAREFYTNIHLPLTSKS